MVGNTSRQEIVENEHHEVETDEIGIEVGADVFGGCCVGEYNGQSEGPAKSVEGSQGVDEAIVESSDFSKIVCEAQHATYNLFEGFSDET